jgi:uncharacterized protein with HEPN domain
MPLEPTDAALLWDMLESAASIVDMVGGMTYEQYRQDRRTRRAVEREIEIIDEAARHVSLTLQRDHPGIPWRKIAAQRHRLAHEYAGIQDEIIWKVATVHVPELLALLRPLVPAPPTDSDPSDPRP